MPGIVIGIAHQKYQPPSHALGQCERRLRQGAPNTLSLTFGIDRQWPQEQRLQRIQPQRPETDRPHQGATGMGDVAELGQWRQAVAITIGSLAPAVWAEGAIEQGFDLRAVRGPFRCDQEHGEVHGEQRMIRSPGPGNL